MKKSIFKKVILLFTFNLLILNVFSQAPQSFKYQSVVRDANGNAIQNQSVDFKISILQTTSTGTSVYTEEFSTTTNDFGLVNLEIGTGTVISGTFSTIDWGADKYFLQVEIDPDGNGYQLMGTSQLLSVPYALNAAKAENVNNNDTSATNELQILSQTGTTVTLSNGGGTITVADNDDDANNEIQAISFSNDTLYLSNGNSVYLGNYSNIWQQNGNDIYYNNGYVGVGLTDPHGKLIVKGDASIPIDSAIFEVRNKDGQVVFAVYQEGVRIYVDDTGTKSISTKGGFAVGGYNATKSLTNEYLRVTPDSVRIYIEEGSGSKSISTKGGFAIGGYNATKTTPTDYFNVSSSDSAGTIPMPGEARVMWYPLKEAFLAGHVIIENADSVGLNSFATGYQSKALGNYSQAFGYKARAKGNNSTAIGNYANAVDSGSYAIGSGAQATGLRSFALGSTGVDSSGTSTSPTIASGDYAYSFGMGSIANSQGAFAFGTQDTASGWYSLAMGYHTKAYGYYSTCFGYQTLSNFSSTAMGYQTKADGLISTAMGYGTIASGDNSISTGCNSSATGHTTISMGLKNTASGDYGATAIGSNSTASGNNASIAIGNSTTASGEKGATAIGNSTTASGDFGSTALGTYSEASGDFGSMALGYTTIATGESSVAIGCNTKAFGNNGSTALGYITSAYGDNGSIAMGSYSCVYGSYGAIAMGFGSITRGNMAFASGNYTIAKSYIETVFGSYNDTTASTNQTTWVDTDPLFIIGNGRYTNPHNAVTVLKNGNVGINTNTPDKLLTVEGNARVTGNIYYGAIGSATTYSKPDFVFKHNYNKDFDVSYIEKYIKRNGHLPWVTAAKDEKDGINMTRMSFETLEAVENQQLQIIELKKENKEQEKIIQELLKRIEKLEKIK